MENLEQITIILSLSKIFLLPKISGHNINKLLDFALNAQFDGIGPSALDGFVPLLATSKDKLEEKFQNIEIRQDGDMGLVTFNYDFVINDKVHHSGLVMYSAPFYVSCDK